MRNWIDLVESNHAVFTYRGNCTDSHMAHGLQDMLDGAKKISYRTLVSAVGRNQLADTFPNFDWSRQPRHLTMVNDYVVRYYRSFFDGKPCYYVRESGIEYIFVNDNALSDDMIAQIIRPDGSTAEIGSGGIYTIHLIRSGVADVSQSTAATSEAKTTLLAWLKDHQIHTVIESDEEIPIGEFIDSL